MHSLTYFFAIQPFGLRSLSNHTGHDRLRYFQHIRQALALRVSGFLQAQPPARITLAGQQRRCAKLGTAV